MVTGKNDLITIYIFFPWGFLFVCLLFFFKVKIRCLVTITEKNVKVDGTFKKQRKKWVTRWTFENKQEEVEPKQNCSSHLCGVTNRSTVFCDRLGHTRLISRFRSASFKRCARTPEGEPTNMSHQICARRIIAIHINIQLAARDSGFCSFCLSPDASLISRAVRIRAISVEVKCTVLSSAMGMFIFTNRWEEWKQRGGAMNQDHTINSSGKKAG